MVYLFPRASIIKFHKLSDLNTEIYFLTVLEAGSLSSSVSRATLPLKALGKGLFQASLFFWCISGLWQHNSNLHMAFSRTCLCVEIFPFVMPVILIRGLPYSSMTSS